MLVPDCDRVPVEEMLVPCMLVVVLLGVSISSPENTSRLHNVVEAKTSAARSRPPPEAEHDDVEPRCRRKKAVDAWS